MADIAGKKAKIKIAAGMAAVLIFAIIAPAFLLDADQFRPQIEASLSAELGRDVRLGKLRLSLFPGRLSAYDVSIMDNPEFGESPFVTAHSFYIGVKLRPLIFSRKVHITEISLDRPSVYLRRSAEGKWNFSDLGVGIGEKNNADIRESERVAEIRIGLLLITDGHVEVVRAGKEPSAYEKVILTVDNLSRDAVVPFALTAALEGGGNVALRGSYGPLNRDNTLLTPLEAAVKITRFDPAASGVIPADTGFSGLLDFSGELNSDGHTARSKGKASVAKLRLVSEGARVGKPVSFDYDLRYDLNKKTGTLTDATVGFGQAAMRFSVDFDASGDVHDLKMTMKGSGVPVDEIQEFLPALGVTLPNGAAFTGGTLNAEITAKGYLNDLTMDVMAEVTGTTLAGFDLGNRIASVANVVGVQSGLDTQIERLYASMRRTADGIAVNDIRIVIPALGDVSGTGTISPRQELDLVMRATISADALTKFTKGKAFDVNFFIRGAAADPEFVLDYKESARSLIDAVLGEGAGVIERLMDSLKGFLGSK
jgi:AsmA protein